MQLLAIFALVLAFVLGFFALYFFVKSARAFTILERFVTTLVILCIAAAIAYGSLTVLVGGAA
jgi:hypothetical protein